MNDDMIYPALNQEDVDTANRLEFERDFEGLDKFWNEMDVDAFNAAYFEWMAEFETTATPDEGFPANMDVDYAIVDEMFEEGLTPQEAVIIYWLRV